MEIIGQLSLVFAGYVVAILVNRTAFRRDHKVKQQDRLRAAYVDVFVAMNTTLAAREPASPEPISKPTYTDDSAPAVNYERANHELAMLQVGMDRFKELTRAMYVLAMLESEETFMADSRALAGQLCEMIETRGLGGTAERKGEQTELTREIAGFIEKIRLSHPLLKAA